MNQNHDRAMLPAEPRAKTKAAEKKSIDEYGRRASFSDGTEMRPAKIGGWREVKTGVDTLWRQLSPRSLSVWRRRDVLVISAVELADAPDGKGDSIHQWHVSVSAKRGRPTDIEYRQALASFGMTGAEEDNHQPGNARHAWRPIDPARRVSCECKETDQIVVEPDGYTWSHEPGSTSCCEVAAMHGKPCPLHPAEVAP